MNVRIDVSVIVPFYHGNRFIDELIANLNKCIDNTNLSWEMILINDSPEVSVIYNVIPKFSFKVINNKFNVGIQLSRIRGLKKAVGDYIIFLDQDDVLIPQKISSQFNLIGGNDICIGNGILEEGGKKKNIFNTRIMQKMALNKNVLLRYGTVIVSPGQCLIRRKAIPVLWLNTPLKINGADDEFLWLLMSLKKRKCAINTNSVYIHKETGNNLSHNFSKMARSSLEYGEKIYKNGLISPLEYTFFKRRREFKIKRYNTKHKIKVDLKYIDVCFYALMIKLLNLKLNNI